MLFKPGERVRYEGRGKENLGLRFGMEGEVVRCFPESVDVYYKELDRVVHFMDFHMRTSLRRVQPANAEGKESRSSRKAVRLIACFVLITAIAVIVVGVLKLKLPALTLSALKLW